jgi:hypothetical protein
MSITITQDSDTLTIKSGKGARHGAISEVSAFLSVKPGRVDALRAACYRFQEGLKNASPALLQRFGLHDMRHVIFDNDTRLLWITSFETDWDPYLDDSVNMLGINTWIDWLQHCVECPEDVGTYTSDQVKVFLQSAQIKAACFFRTLPDLTLAEIKKGQRIREALEQVIDTPDGVQALEQPTLKPLLDEAAD